MLILMARHCPDCDLDMTPRSFFGVLVDTCPECGGIFFDEGEVSQIRARGGDRAFEELDDIVQPNPNHIPHEESQFRKCPSCLSGMHRFRYMYSSPVFLDSCESCGGVFIENGELKQMKEYLQAGKSKQAPVLDPESKEDVATLEVMTIEQNEKAHRAHWVARAMAFYPWL